MRQIVDSVNASVLVLRFLKEKENYQWSNLFPLNKYRYYQTVGNPNIAIVFKHQWFLKYGDFASTHGWKNEEGQLETGIGDSINKDDLKTMLKNEVKDVLIIYQAENMDGYHIYRIGLIDFLRKSHDFTNKEGKEVKSISIHNYTRIN